MSDPRSPCFLLPSFYPGGAERVLITLFGAYNHPGKHMIVVNGGGALREMAMAAGPVIDLHAKRFFLSLWPLYRTLQQLKPRVIVSTMAHMNFMVLLLKPFLPRGTKIIVREANVPSSLVDGVKLKFLVKWGYKILYPFADMVISPSQKIIDEFTNYLHMDTRRHVLLRNPVDVKRIRACASEKFFAKKGGSVNFVAVGRLHYQKGFDRLIEACAHLKMSPDWSLTIYGEGKEREALETQIARLGLQNKIKLAGLTDNPWAPMAAADALLLSSRWEGLPNAVLESLAVGTPVIAMAEAGGIGEIAALVSGSVTIVESLDAFRVAMQGVGPDAQSEPRDSLLPADFSEQAIIQRFAELVESVVATA